MFIRKSKKKDKNTGKSYYSFQLMESYRSERGPRQRLLLNLGSDLNLEDDERKQLADRMEELKTGSASLLSYPPHIEKLAQTYFRILSKKGDYITVEEETVQHVCDFQTVDINTLQNMYARSAGLEHIVLETIRKLELDSLLGELKLTPRQKDVMLGVIIGKLCKPSSELAAHHWLQNTSGIDELLNTDFSRLSRAQVYKASDRLLANKETIESHLVTKERNLFGFENTIYLCDLTNTYFEGEAESIELAARGKSKEKRSDCPLVTLGLVLNPEGFPLKSQTLPGNISEPKSLKSALDQLKCGSKPPVVVLDAGIATEDNLRYLRENDYSYLVASRRTLSDIPQNISEPVTGKPGIRVSQLERGDTGETHIYCQSEDRKGKEEGIRTLKQARLEEDLQLAASALSKKGGVKSYSKVLERVGRIKERHSSIARYYKIEVVPNEDKSRVTKIEWEVDSQGLDSRYQGIYLLKAYGLDWTSEQFWKTYVMLTKVEESFRCLKSELGLRPIYHQVTHRVEGHLFITVLAYHIMQAILFQLRQLGIKKRWSTIRDIMSTQVRITTTMKARDGRMLNVRSSTIAEQEQKEIYKALNISPRAGITKKSFS